MFAVIANWQIEAGSLDSAQLVALAAIVQRHPGFVRGWWGVDTGQPTTAYAVVVLDTRARAMAFAAGVTASIGSLRVRVVEVLATAGPGCSSGS